MDYMFVPGFLGTRAPFYMDFVTLIVAFLPFLVALAIFLAKKGLVRTHIIFQLLLFFFSLVVVGYFEYGVRVDGGYEKFAGESSLPEGFIFGFLLLHIGISILTTIWWFKTIWTAIRDYRRKLLPGAKSYSHLRSGKLTALGIFLTAFTGIWVYLFLFVF